MASYIRQPQQAQPQAPIAPAPAAPAAPLVGAAPAGSFLSDAPQAQKPTDYGRNPVNDVANFSGSPLPRGGNVTATSHGSGSPFGYNFADPNAAAAIMAGLSNYHYSVPAGGYLHNDYPSGPLGGGHNEYYIGESHMTGSDPNANKAVGDIYAQLGALPRVQAQSGALAKLGVTPSGGPTINQTLQQAGINSPWGGPWEFPGWHLG